MQQKQISWTEAWELENRVHVSLGVDAEGQLVPILLENPEQPAARADERAKSKKLKL